MEKKICKYCIYSRDLGNGQVICGKTNHWQVEHDTCTWFTKKKSNFQKWLLSKTRRDKK